MIQKKVIPTLMIVLIVGVAILLVAATNQPLPEASPGPQAIPALQDEATPVALDERPFQLPFADPPGPDSWLLGQPYGNTIGAYYQRNTLYGASGGIHFGVDLSAKCGTEIIAIADGVIFQVDGPFGSPPHNLMIDHPDLGYASLYGHLLEAPSLRPGQQVKQGDVIALVGSSVEDCSRAPHLHLEIRDLNHFRKFNPTTLIDANWDNLALVGGSRRGFMRNLDDPRQWQSLYDQPVVQTGGPIVNDFESTWPLDWRPRE
ncbi:MAG: M23 family metallopeptidase [Chloroflexota bacterium]